MSFIARGGGLISRYSLYTRSVIQRNLSLRGHYSKYIYIVTAAASREIAISSLFIGFRRGRKARKQVYTHFSHCLYIPYMYSPSFTTSLSYILRQPLNTDRVEFENCFVLGRSLSLSIYCCYLSAFRDIREMFVFLSMLRCSVRLNIALLLPYSSFRRAMKSYIYIYWEMKMSYGK